MAIKIPVTYREGRKGLRALRDLSAEDQAFRKGDALAIRTSEQIGADRHVSDGKPHVLTWVRSEQQTRGVHRLGKQQTRGGRKIHLRPVGEAVVAAPPRALSNKLAGPDEP